MPAASYVAICQALGIDNQFVLQGSYHLQFAPLYDALWSVFGDALLDLRKTSNSTGFNDIERHNRKQAAAHDFTLEISEAYATQLQDRLQNDLSKKASPFAATTKGK